MRWLATILIAASVLRFASLSDRPMHADEAILADRLGTLLASGTFQYDPSDYHGPVLPFASLPFAWVSGAASYASLNEAILRAVPAFAGLLTVGFSWFIGLAVSGRRAAVICALFTALSPGLVYFSRYYIPEQLLVCLSAGLLFSLIRYSQRPESNIRLRWAIAAGLFAGLMYVTKETAVLAFAAFGIALAALRPRVRPAHAAVVALTALAVAALAYTPGALIKSFQSFSTYTARAFGPELHAHPWHYYFEVLFRSGDLVFVLLALSIVPTIRARNHAATLLLIYSAVLTLLYSALRYKTPWCAMGFLHGWILVSGIGIADLTALRRRRAVLAPAPALAVLLLALTVRANFQLAADQANPYVYAHTLPGVYRLVDRAATLASAHPDGTRIPIQVFTRQNLWPLPWYFRDYPNVTWWRAVPEQAPRAPLILVSPEMEDEVASHLYERPKPGERDLYVNLFEDPLWLRPGVEVRGYAAISLAGR